MRILIQPPNPDPKSFEIDHELQRALAVLRGSIVRIRGAGRFGDEFAAVVLERETDLVTALDALKHAGIRASTVMDTLPEGLKRHTSN